MELLDFILHVDDHLLEFITNYGIWIYAILFLIIFVETGLVVMPFLPGDKLIVCCRSISRFNRSNGSSGSGDPAFLLLQSWATR